MALGFFDIQSLVGLAGKDGYDFIKEKLKKEDADFNDFLAGLEKKVKAACNEYRLTMETRFSDKIDLPESCDDYIYRRVINALRHDKAVKLSELPLPGDMTVENKELFFTKLEEKLIHSFEYYARIGIKRILEDTAEIKGKIDDLKTATQFRHKEQQKNHFLTTPPTKVSKEFIHRDDFINDIRQALKDKSKIMLVNGLGGIGKTSVARALFHLLEGEYTYAAWIEYNENLKQSVLSSVGLFEEIKEPDERYRAIKKFIQESRDTLLIIDNVSKTDIDDSELQWLETMKNTVILTSRINEIGAFEAYPVRSFDSGECIDVFYGYYKYDVERKCFETVKNIVKLASNHTLTVELLAKAANRPGVVLTDFYSNLVDKGFGYSDYEVKTQHKRDELTAVQHIKRLYEIVGVSEEQENILKNFAVMPSIEIPFEVEKWLGANINKLADLVKLGWLSRLDSGYYMHPVIKESMLLNSEVEFTECEKVIRYMAYGDYIRDTDVYGRVRILLDIADSFYNYFNENESGVFSGLCGSMGIVYYAQGEYKKALEYYNKALKIKEKVYGAEHPSTAQTYNNMGVTYELLGEYEKALDYYNKALKIREKMYGTEHPSTAQTYNNMGNVYQLLDEYEKALEYYNKALDALKKYLGAEHPYTKKVIYNIARIEKQVK